MDNLIICLCNVIHEIQVDLVSSLLDSAPTTTGRTCVKAFSCQLTVATSKPFMREWRRPLALAQSRSPRWRQPQVKSSPIAQSKWRDELSITKSCTRERPLSQKQRWKTQAPCQSWKSWMTLPPLRSLARPLTHYPAAKPQETMASPWGHHCRQTDHPLRDEQWEERRARRR